MKDFGYNYVCEQLHVLMGQTELATKYALECMDIAKKMGDEFLMFYGVVLYYEAINNGIKVATGDVVGVLHSDDFFTSADILESVARTFSDSSIDMVYGDVHFVNTNSPERVLRYYSGAWFDRKKLRYGIAPPHPSMYCRREVYLKYGLYSTDYKIAGDFDMFVRLLWKWEITARYLPVDMVTMRTGGISTRWSSRLWRNTAEKHRVLLDNGIKTSWWQVLYRYVLLLCHYSWHRSRK